MRRAAQSGFTLVELVIAMVLLGIMISLMYSGITFSLRSWDAADANGRLVADRRLGENFLRREISEIFPMRWKDPMSVRYAFEGSEHVLRFVSSRPAGVSQGGLALASVGIEPDADHPKLRNLVMRRALADPDAADFSALDDAKPSVLVEDVSSVDFTYFGAENDFAEPRWWQSWPFPNHMPSIIRLSMAAGDGSPLPDMIVPILVGEEAGCLETALQRGCRPRRS